MAPPKNAKNWLFVGSFIHSKTLDELEYLHETAVCVDTSGRIVAVEPAHDLKKAQDVLYPKLGWEAGQVEIHVAREGEFFFPGFIDTHIHAPQYPNSGLFGKSTLLDWLNTYTFPMEASLGRDLGRARRVYGAVVRRTLAHGTTTAAYYATIDVAATNLLADLCLARGQRAFVGRVCMDRLGPDDYVDAGPAESLARTRASVAHIRAIDPDFDLVCPILTPRFAPTCTSETLAALGRLARGQDDSGDGDGDGASSSSSPWTPGEDATFHLPIQTHISENPSEVALVRALFPGHASYAAVYDAHGLLGPRTVLAHAVHLTAGEAALAAARRAGVAHCPCSNSALTSGAARVRWLLARGLRVGLGTDVSGGYSASVLEAARQALLVSRHVAMAPAPLEGRRHDGDAHADADEDERARERERAKLSVDEVLYLATRGGAEILGLRERVGAFEVGLEFDAQLVSLGGVVGEGERVDDDDDAVQKEDRGNVDMFGWESWEERVAKWLFNGDDRNTKKVWVRGRLVHSRA